MRADLEIIQQWVKPGHHVLDLGCGDGTLLNFLQKERNASGFGLEINPDHITTCMNRGVSVIEQNLDTQGLENFDDNSFDIVLMTQALQAVRRPDKVLDEMLRLGGEGIVTFPNFAHWRLRWGWLLVVACPNPKPCRTNGTIRRTYGFAPSRILRPCADKRHSH